MQRSNSIFTQIIKTSVSALELANKNFHLMPVSFFRFSRKNEFYFAIHLTWNFMCIGGADNNDRRPRFPSQQQPRYREINTGSSSSRRYIYIRTHNQARLYVIGICKFAPLYIWCIDALWRARELKSILEHGDRIVGNGMYGQIPQVVLFELVRNC